jgi:hypothetical protein
MSPGGADQLDPLSQLAVDRVRLSPLKGGDGTDGLAPSLTVSGKDSR